MEIPVLLAVLVVSGVRAIDETTITSGNEPDETTMYDLGSTMTDSSALSSSSDSSKTTMKSSVTTTTMKTTTSTSTTSTSSTTSPSPPNPNEWDDLDDKESEILVKFVVGEIQKLKVEHKELDGCQELDLSSVLSGKKQVGKPTKYSVTLKVQPQMKDTEECKHENSTVVNMHPEICEADILEGDHGGTSSGKTLLRSTCLQVEELQD